jgi:hypothetical protein
VGKTRLALRLAELAQADFAGGVVFVSRQPAHAAGDRYLRTRSRRCAHPRRIRSALRRASGCRVWYDLHDALVLPEIWLAA